MRVQGLQDLKSKELPTVPPDFFQPEYVRQRVGRDLPIGTVVCLRLHYHDRNDNNPEQMWGYVYNEYCFVRWMNDTYNSYIGGELCTLEEFMSEHGNVLPFSWRI